MGGNKGANKGMHYSHSEKFWRSRYERVKLALADDEPGLNRFNSAVKDLNTFEAYWNMNGGRWDRVVETFRSPTSTAETKCEHER